MFEGGRYTILMCMVVFIFVMDMATSNTISGSNL